MLSKRVEKWRQDFIAKGKAEGKAEGRAEGKAEVARNLLEAGISIEKVVLFTGLSEQIVRDIQDSIAH